MNNWNGIGRLGSDPDVKYFEGGSVKARIRIALDAYKQEQTLWLTVEAWGKTAEVIANYCRKGSQIGISGELRENQWEAKDGSGTRKELFVNASRIDLLGSKAETGYNDDSF